SEARQARGHRRDPSRAAPDPFVHHARGGRSDEAQARPAGGRRRQGNERHDRAAGMSKRSAFLALSFLLLVACSKSATGANGGSSQTLTVFAASSLTKAFGAIGSDFQAANPGAKVTFDFGPSDGLANQIESEGTADVFASASGTWMDDVQSKTGVADRTDFAKNRLVIITPPDNPAGVQSLADLARPGVSVVLAAEGVPVGDYARQALDAAGLSKQVLANVVSNEQD